MTAHLNFMATNMARNNPVIMGALEKNIFEHISLMALEQVEIEFQNEMMQMQAMGNNPQAMQDPRIQQMMMQLTMKIESRKAVLIAEMMEEFKKEDQEINGNFGNDPIAQLKSRELDLQAQENARRKKDDENKLNLEKMKTMMNQVNQQEKLEQNEDLAELRAATSIAKQQMSNMNKKGVF